MPIAPTFEQIVEAHQQMVFRTLARLVGQEHLEDLAQEVFLRLYRALPGFRGEAEITTYLYRIAVNVAHNEWTRLRKEDRRHVSFTDEDAGWEDRIADAAPNPAAELGAREFSQLLEDQLALLPAVERAVLVLYHQEERTYDQIADTLAIPLNTVRTHLHRARKRLRAAVVLSTLTVASKVSAR